MGEIVDFETTLANITVPQEERRDEELIYHKMQAKDLTVGVSWFDLANNTTVYSASLHKSRPLLQRTKGSETLYYVKM